LTVVSCDAAGRVRAIPGRVWATLGGGLCDPCEGLGDPWKRWDDPKEGLGDPLPWEDPGNLWEGLGDP
jgi:hypothetical protein